MKPVWPSRSARITGSRATGDPGMMPPFKIRYYPLVQQDRAIISEPQMIVGQTMGDRRRDDAWAQDPLRNDGNVYSKESRATDVIRRMAQNERAFLWQPWCHDSPWPYTHQPVRRPDPVLIRCYRKLNSRRRPSATAISSGSSTLNGRIVTSRRTASSSARSAPGELTPSIRPTASRRRA